LILIGEISICFDTAAYFPKNPELEADKNAVDKAYDFMVRLNIQHIQIQHIFVNK